MKSRHTSRRIAGRGGQVLVALGVLLLGASGCPGPRQEPLRVSVRPGPGQQELTEEQIVELARAEGELTWYTSLPQADAELILQRFAARYPFIRTRLERGGSFTIAQRVSDQIAAGRVEADVLHVLDPSTFVTLRHQGALLYYHPPEAQAIPPGHRDPGYWTAARAVTLGMAYDASRTPSEQAPGSWQDLVSEDFRGRVGLKDAETAGAAYALYFLLRERYGTIYWERLAARRPRLYRTAAQMVEALQSGEIAVAAGIAGNEDLDSAADGTTIHLVWPEDGLPMIVGPVAILAAAPHPACARLFAAWLLSAEGQGLITEAIGTHSLRTDLPPPPGRAALDVLSLLLPTAGWDDYAAKREILRGEFSRLFDTAVE